MLFSASHDPSLLDSPARLRAIPPALRSREPDAALQALVARAAAVSGFPIAAVTLVLERTQRVRAHFGLVPGALLELPREHTLCQYLVTGGREVEVQDVLQEPGWVGSRARVNGVRAYMGLPLRVQGQVVGGLCVADLEPRALLAHQRAELRMLAARAERRLAQLLEPAAPRAPASPDIYERIRERVEAARRAAGALAPRNALQLPAPAPRPTTEEVAYQHTLEGLFHKGLKGRITEALVARLKPLGLDLSQPLRATYPRIVYQRAMMVTALELWPQLPPERAYFELGRSLTTGYMQTLLGRSILTMMRLLGPRSTLRRMQHNMRTGTSYSRVDLVEEAPNRFRFWVNEPELHPAIAQGLLEAVLQCAGAQGAQVQPISRDAQGCTYLVSWQE